MCFLGGKLVAVDNDDYVGGIKQLFTLLANGKVEGLILDKYLFNLFKVTVSEPDRYVITHH